MLLSQTNVGEQHCTASPDNQSMTLGLLRLVDLVDLKSIVAEFAQNFDALGWIVLSRKPPRLPLPIESTSRLPAGLHTKERYAMTHAAVTDSLAERMQDLGGIDASRVRSSPAPGMA